MSAYSDFSSTEAHGTIEALFGVSAVACTLVVYAIVALYYYCCTNQAVPRLQLRVMFWPGLGAGLCWSAGNIFGTLAVERGGNAVTLGQVNTMQLIVSGVWGLLWYKEIRGWHALVWVVAAIFEWQYQMAAKGMLFVIGDAERLLDGSLGTFGEEGDVLNRFEDMGLTVFDFLKYPEVREEILPCFLMDKAMVFCGKTGRILGNKFGIKSIAKGIKTAGTKLQAASAISQEDTVANKWWVEAPYWSSCPPT